MSGIKKENVIVNHSVITDFTKDMGFYQVTMSVYSCVCPTKSKSFVHDITEIEFEFYINEEKVLYRGFEELYVKLFGSGSFAGLLHKLEQEAEKAYFATTEYPVCS